jgi:hypothetical protein
MSKLLGEPHPGMPTTLGPDHWLGWQIAALDSRPGGRRGWIMNLAFLSIFGAAWSYSSNLIAMLTVLWIGASFTTYGLGGTIAYPTSRRRRARIAFVDSSFQIFCLMVMTAMLTAGLFWVHPWPQFLAEGHESGEALWPLAAAAVICTPIIAWGPSRPAVLDFVAELKSPGSGVATRFLGMLATLPAMMGVGGLMQVASRHLGVSAVIAIAIFALLLSQGLYFVVLTRAYRRRDLV